MNSAPGISTESSDSHEVRHIENTQHGRTMEPSNSPKVTNSECVNSQTTQGVESSTTKHRNHSVSDKSSRSADSPPKYVERNFSSSDESDSLEWSTATGKIPAPTWV